MMKIRPVKFLPIVTATISTNLTAPTLFTLCGSPAYACRAVITLNAQTLADGIGNGMYDGAFPAGSMIKLINNGTINGGTLVNSACIQLLYTNMVIDNANGYITAPSQFYQAIKLNGHTVTWAGGYNGTQVVGLVS